MATLSLILQSLLYGFALVLAGGGAFQLGRAIGEASLKPPPRRPTVALGDDTPPQEDSHPR